MAWVRLDEGFPDHPKVVTAGPLAGWLHVCALAYCNRYLTDGFVPAGKVPALADYTGLAVVRGMGVHEVDVSDLADALVEAGIWEERRGGYLIHDYLTYQPSRSETEAKRKVKQVAGQAGGVRSGVSRRGGVGKQSTDPANQTGSNGEANHEAPAKQNGSKPEASGQAKQEAKTKPGSDTEEIYPPPPLRRSSTNGTAGPNPEVDQKPEPPPTDPPASADHEKLMPLAEHMAEALWPGRRRMLSESVLVVRKCLAVADPALVDECIGVMITADDAPRSPNYLATTVRNRLVGMGAYTASDEALAVLGVRA